MLTGIWKLNFYILSIFTPTSGISLKIFLKFPTVHCLNSVFGFFFSVDKNTTYFLQLILRELNFMEDGNLFEQTF